MFLHASVLLSTFQKKKIIISVQCFARVRIHIPFYIHILTIFLYCLSLYTYVFQDTSSVSSTSAAFSIRSVIKHIFGHYLSTHAAFGLLPQLK